MSDPTTPTGKRVVAALAAGHEVPDDDILAIEREAAAVERERIAPKTIQATKEAEHDVELRHREATHGDGGFPIQATKEE